MNIIIIMRFFFPLTLFLYFSYGAKASNLRCTIMLLVAYCVQNMKRQKLVLMLGGVRVKKPSFVTSHFHVLFKYIFKYIKFFHLQVSDVRTQHIRGRTQPVFITT